MIPPAVTVQLPALFADDDISGGPRVLIEMAQGKITPVHGLGVRVGRFTAIHWRNTLELQIKTAGHAGCGFEHRLGRTQNLGIGQHHCLPLIRHGDPLKRL
ncbi:MAG TPA: hypothetical protein DCZ13_11645 [Porticoccaceae bacterium]|nr:hypothetical protein [Porticoccaceae bacterium]